MKTKTLLKNKGVIRCIKTLHFLKRCKLYQHNAMKDPHRYAVQVSDTTILPGAASLFGQYFLKFSMEY